MNISSALCSNWAWYAVGITLLTAIGLSVYLYCCRDQMESHTWDFCFAGISFSLFLTIAILLGKVAPWPGSIQFISLVVITVIFFILATLFILTILWIEAGMAAKQDLKIRLE